MFLDLKRAFETIDRKRLIVKMRKMGCQPRAIRWFETYLAERSQCTIVNGITSSPVNNGLGVPQGSVLGAILFILYINDLPGVLKRDAINLFADDTLIYIHGSDLRELKRLMNEELEIINQWLRLNRLKVNVCKTKCLEIGSSSEEVTGQVVMDGEEIETVGHIKYLGVLIDCKLNFKENFEHVCKKIARKVGVLSRLSKDLTFGARCSIYQSVIAPHFDYCSSILFLGNEAEFDKLQKLQNRVMRVVLRCSRYTSIEIMLNALNWLSVKQRVYKSTLTFIHRLKSVKLPKYLNELVVYNRDIHNYPTRSKDDFHLKRKGTVAAERCLFHKGVCVYNNLPVDIKRENSETLFKRKLIERLKVTVPV